MCVNKILTENKLMLETKQKPEIKRVHFTEKGDRAMSHSARLVKTSSNLRDFAREVSVHGIKHLTIQHPASRYFWFSSLVVASVCSAWVFMELLLRYRAAPTYLSVIKQQSFIENFPSVILCPETNFPQKKIDRFVNTFRMPPNVSADLVRSNLRQLAAFMDPDVVFNDQMLVLLESILEYNSVSVQQASFLLMPSCQESILRCYWRAEPWNCKALFTEVLTGDGICCGFNGRSIYDQDRIAPLLIPSVSSSSGLVIVVSHTEPPTTVDLGYKWLVIQEQERFYEVKNNGTALNPGYEYFFGHHTHRLVSSRSVIHLEKSLRSCVEQNENPLRYFPTYDRSYCKAECEVQATLTRCGCVLYTSPVREGLPYCRASLLRCAQLAAAMANCDCPESCEFSVSRMTRNVLYLIPPQYVVHDSIYGGLDPQHMSVVRVFAPDTRAEVVYRRECYFTFFFLISQFGGVFGVFLGCSFISAVEVLFLAWKTLPGLLRKIRIRKANKETSRIK